MSRSAPAPCCCRSNTRRSPPASSASAAIVICMQHVPVAYRPPFALGSACFVDMRPHGESIFEMVLSVPQLPPLFLSRGVVCINGELVPRELWARVRPKPTSDQLPIAVTLHWPLQGGGKATTKSVIGIVAALALIVVTGGIASGALLGGLSAGIPSILGITGAQILAAGVGIAGALAISALTAPPTAAAGIAGPDSDSNTDNREAASASGNIIAPGGPIPRVLGTRKVFPPLVCEPVVELVDTDEYVEALFALNGPHLLEDIRIDGLPIADSEDVEVESREGWQDDDPVTLVERQGRTSAPNILMSQHQIAAGTAAAGVNLADQSLPERNLPVWHGIASRSSPDEIWIHLLLPGGISDAGGTVSKSIPFRVRFRLRGDTTWTNVPELHLTDATTQQLRRAIIFKWATAESNASGSVPTANGWTKAWVEVPQQNTAPVPAGSFSWQADSYFDDGSGDAFLENGNETSSRVRRLVLYDNRVEIFLDEGTFPKGIYEFEIKRGATFGQSNLNDSYVYSTTTFIHDFFYYYTSGGNDRVPQSLTNVSDRVQIVRLISIWNEYPVLRQGFSLIAIRARNRAISRLSVNASGYVRDWGGSAWDTWTTTSNPAPHYADVLSGDQNIDPLEVDLRDDDSLTDWRTLCTTNDWTCDAIIDDMRTQDVLSLLASCGYARPYQSDVYGVTVDNDRSLDSPVQVFSRRNAANVHYERGFIRVPEGFVVSYRDETEDDDRAQTVVYQRDRSIATTGMLESVAFEGIIDTAKVTARAQFDLDQANLRSTFYSFDTDIESIVCRRGDLVAMQHDIITTRAGDGHIVSKQVNAG